MTPQGKLTVKDKCGYGSASVADAIAYSFMATFLLFFLTTVAGIQPAIAGTLSALGSVWDAVMNPFMGYLSDHASTKLGRRRPFMLLFSIPLMIVMILLFTAFDMAYAIKVVFYGLMVILFWTSFTGFFVPYYALGAEYSQDYDERTSIRSYATFFNMMGTLFSMAIPMWAIECMTSHGMTEEHAWTLTATVLGAMSTASILITTAVSGKYDNKEKCRASSEAKSDETEARAKESLNPGKMFREYFEVLSLKPVRFLLMHSLFFLIAYSMLMSTFVYFFTYNKGADGNEMSIYLAIRCVFGILIIPLADMLCRKTDKRTAMLICLSICCIFLIIFRVIPLNNIVAIVIFIMVSSASTCLYWQIVPAIFYDVCEYDEYETGQRREGTILAVQGLTEAIAAGLGTQILGIILQFAGFDGNAEVQTETALKWIYNCTTWVPVIVMVIAAFALYRFPITKKYYNHIVRELNERKKND